MARSADPHLDPLEQRIRSRLPAEAVAVGNIALLQVVELSKDLIGLHYNNNRATIRRLCDALGIIPHRDERAGHSRAKAVWLDDGVALLLGCQLIKDHDKTPRAAAALIHAYHERHGRISGTQLLETQVRVALDKFHRDVRAPLVGALLSVILGGQDPPIGTIAYVQPLGRETSSLDRAAATWAKGQLEMHLRNPAPDGLLAIVGETHEMMFVPSLSPAVLAGRRSSAIVLPQDSPQFLVLIALPADAEHATGGAPKMGELASDVEASAFRLLQAIGPAFDNLKVLAGQSLSQRSIVAQSHEQAGSKKLLLWLLASFACEIARPASRTARCLIFEPRPDPPSGQPILRPIAFSETPPWTEGAIPRPVLQLGQLLSGYASLTNLTLAIPRTEPPLNQLVSEHDYESAQGAEGRLSCIALPLAIRDRRVSPVLYIWMAPADDRDEWLVKVLQVLAPVVGELIERSRDGEHAVLTYTEAASARFLSTSELRLKIAAKFREMLGAETAARRDSSADSRVAFLVLGASRGKVAYGDEFAIWLTDQFQHLVPRGFLAPLLSGKATATDPAQVIFGNAGDEACLVMVPTVLRKVELDELRAKLPTYLNGLPTAVAQDGAAMVRLNVWVIDEKWQVVEDVADAAGLEKLAKRIITKAASAAKVLPDVIEAHRRHVAGHWDEALQYAKSGLDTEPSNPYLNRRAAEFNVYEGDFVAAEQCARDALKYEIRSMSAHCLLGDALLGQGKIAEALAAYDAAAEIGEGHPLPSYSRGFALLTLARLLWQAADERARESFDLKDASKREALKMRVGIVDRYRERLCAAAERALARAQTLTMGTEFPASYDTRSVYGAPTIFGLYQINRARRNILGAVQALQRGTKVLPRDDLLQRELIMARMWLSGLATELFESCADGSLQLRLGEGA